MVELHTLGSMPLVELLIARCLELGARAAQPGEFTMRAFLAGKLDLTRAEAVLGVMEARDAGELHEALTQLSGGVAQPLQVLREDLLSLLADVEAGLDFADEHIEFISSDNTVLRVGAALAHLTLVRKQLEERALPDRPFRVVLAGKPNAGSTTARSRPSRASVSTAAAEFGASASWISKRAARASGDKKYAMARWSSGVPATSSGVS